MIELLIGGLIALVVIVLFVIIYNSLVSLSRNIDRAFANIDVLEKQRFDEIPNLIEACKGYMRYEEKLFNEITKARTAWMEAKTVDEKARASDMISRALKTLFATAENYPDLKAVETFKHLQMRISGLENEIADRREFYNDAVTTFNTRIAQIPYNIVARMLGYKPKELLQVPEEEKEPVKVEF
jgi:LemA protein